MVLGNKNKTMKKLLILAVLLLGISRKGSSACQSGGPGATSCTTTVTVGPVSTTHTVACGSGYYACCSAVGAHCKENTTGSGNQQ